MKNIPEMRMTDDQRAHFYRLLRISKNAEYAARIALGTSVPICGIQTDSTYFSGVGTLADQFGNDERGMRRLIKKAKSQGYNPCPNDFYNPTLASREGDPRAFVKQSDGRSYVKKRCMERGVSCHGMVNYEAPERPPEQHKPKLSERAIRDGIKSLIRRNPDLKHVPKQKLREELIDKHAYVPG